MDAEFNLAYDRSGGPHDGRLYAVWLSETPDESNNTDVMFTYSDDNGKTWSTALKVNDDAGTNSQFNQAIAVDQSTGNVGIGWFDCRRDHGQGGAGDTNGIPNDDAQFWMALSLDGGQTVTPNRRSARGTSNAADAHSSTDYGDYTHVAFVVAPSSRRGRTTRTARATTPTGSCTPSTSTSRGSPCRKAA